MKLNKILFICVALLTALTFAACGSKENEELVSDATAEPTAYAEPTPVPTPRIVIVNSDGDVITGDGRDFSGDTDDEKTVEDDDTTEEEGTEGETTKTVSTAGMLDGTFMSFSSGIYGEGTEEPYAENFEPSITFSKDGTFDVNINQFDGMYTGKGTYTVKDDVIKLTFTEINFNVGEDFDIDTVTFTKVTKYKLRYDGGAMGMTCSGDVFSLVG